MRGTATLLLVRHGLTPLTGGSLAGWTPGVHLDERGRAQARDLARRLAPLDLAAVVTSPLERCRETAEAVVGANPEAPAPVIDDRFGECDYGEWTGRTLRELAEEPLWRVVQAHPSAARFPGGESLAETAHRAVAAVRDWNARLLAEHEHPVYLVCSHGDVIKAVVADALGLHLDQFQRVTADPCSLTAIRYTETRPFLLRANDVGGSVAGLAPTPADTSADAAVGGGAGAVPAGESHVRP
ncbi:histidine phosphatase family protein [Marinitenerispora sediminis]|uniref:Phosphoglycerate mutase n=1 Tax=Marinitenerispora sediminis TaxID=1931232 RepID=A0A368TCF8_9ACTN|nr:histidine phosphatase family protein [Marinitenerispora sediminis]RCV52420.1 phosphoglycerate mutase [Marinitenerispora sediminis]RCV60618.1 phosphoglycerate mutase [Marinitenerispora sediminis]RCV61091.1 phosphoglycerate mutase [Marinitenerispora sediminis]